MADPILQIPARLCGDPRLVSGARLLGTSKNHFLGAMTHLLCQAAVHAEDGDLWKEDEESSISFTAALADWSGEPAEFTMALQKEGWINGWMIMDWLVYYGDHA